MFAVQLYKRLVVSIGVFGLLGIPAAAFDNGQLPNIVIIYADDLGYGDVSCYNPNAAYRTPRLDQMASEGIKFNDGHSPSTVCTPSRYSLMTGKQPYRGPGTGVFSGIGGPSQIKKDEKTFPQMLKSKGYRTGVFGKWHIGLTWLNSSGQRITTGGIAGVQEIDYELSTPLVDGPNTRGFDKSFITACCPLTDFLYAYIVDGMVPVKPTFRSENQSFPNYDGRWRNDFRGGWTASDFSFEGIDWVFLGEAEKFVIDHRANHSDAPFFMMLSTQIAHAPVLPHPDLIGSTGDAGARGDFVYELDTIVGEVFDLLDSLEIDSSTLVLFSADNGPENFHTVYMREYYNHDPARPWRGMKRDAWEGGHRVPFLARWPGVVPAGQVSHQMINQTDIFSTLASLVGYTVPDAEAHDSFDMLPVLLGLQPEDESVRDILLTQTWRNNFFEIRQGPWKYIDGEGSGGNNYDNDMLRPYIIDDPTNAPAQLYNLKTDPDEVDNLYYSNQTKRRELKNILEESKSSGRSAPTGRKPFQVPAGCKDPAFEEYDSTAVFNDIAACLNAKTGLKQDAQSFTDIQLNGSVLYIYGSGFHTVTLRGIDGKLAQIRRGEGKKSYNFAGLENKGLYIVKVELNGLVETGKIILY